MSDEDKGADLKARIDALESKLKQARDEAADERRKRQEFEAKIGELDSAVAKAEAKLQKREAELSNYQTRDKRAEVLRATREKFVSDEANKDKSVAWDKVERYLERVNKDAATLDADIADALQMFAVEAPPPVQGMAIKSDPPKGGDTPKVATLDAMLLQSAGFATATK